MGFPSPCSYVQQAAQTLESKSLVLPLQEQPQTIFNVRSINVQDHFFQNTPGSSHQYLPQPELSQFQASFPDELENVPPMEAGAFVQCSPKKENDAVVKSSPKPLVFSNPKKQQKKARKKKKRKRKKHKNSTAPPNPPANLNRKVHAVENAKKSLEKTFMGRLEDKAYPIFCADTQRELRVRKVSELENLCKNLQHVDKEAKLEKVFIGLDETRRHGVRKRTRGLKIRAL